ncbi:unnamed protein product, partial [Porites evermanni]
GFSLNFTAAFWSGLPQQGECPKNYGTGTCVIPETGGCLTDADCDRELQKCCSSGCNKVCTQAFWPEQRPGECPKFFGLPKCIRLDTSECVNDKDCGNVLQKCCSDGCKTFCLQGRSHYEPCNNCAVCGYFCLFLFHCKTKLGRLPLTVTFWSLPGKCPVDHSVGICVVLPGACYSDDECVEKFGELYKCCPSGCNRFCKKVF